MEINICIFWRATTLFGVLLILKPCPLQTASDSTALYFAGAYLTLSDCKPYSEGFAVSFSPKAELLQIPVEILCLYPLYAKHKLPPVHYLLSGSWKLNDSKHKERKRRGLASTNGIVSWEWTQYLIREQVLLDSTLLLFIVPCRGASFPERIAQGMDFHRP